MQPPPARVAENVGVLDLEDEARRLGADTIAYARERIVATMEHRVARGTLQADDLALDLIRQGGFPAYIYASIDEAWANRRLLGKRKRKPMGVTCCVDEVALFAALLLTRPGRAIEDVAVLGSPAHYTVLLHDAAEGPWWFYGKRDLFCPADWAQGIATHYDGDSQTAFDDRQPNLDRFVTASGRWTATHADDSMDPAEIAALVARCDAFFGTRLRQIEPTLAHSKAAHAEHDCRALFATLAGARDGTNIRARIRSAAVNGNDRFAQRALYAHRTLDVPDPGIYLRVACRSPHLREQAANLTSLDAALAVVAALPGTESIFLDRERIAMPEETLRFAMGTDRDRALLLHALLQHAPALPQEERRELVTLFTTVGSYVTGPGFCIDGATMARVGAPEGDVTHRLADGHVH